MRFAAALGLVAAAATALAATQARTLPLGDGKVSSTPRVGYVDSCAPAYGGGGARGATPWIHGDGWSPSDKPVVAGSVSWSSHRLSIVTSGAATTITANDLPPHPTGRFPIAATDPARRYDANPNAIRAQSVRVVLPSHPRIAAKPSCLPLGPIGVATSGVVFYDALDAAGRDAVAHEIQDRCGGHPDRRGAYHYHAISSCVTPLAGGIVGYALDGFPIVADTGLHDSDLDACHGTVGSVLWHGRRIRMYHYVATAEYPYTLGCFRGTPVRLAP